MPKQIMLDMETLGTRADAVIISIGAVMFDFDTGVIDDEGFYASVSIDSNTTAGRHISESTLVWWIGQSEGAKRVFNEPKITLTAALEGFSDWAGADNTVWSNGADFDIPMISHAYSTHDLETPWKFFNTRCYRTYKNLPGAPKMVDKPKIAHHALYDAKAQAEHAIQIHQALFGLKNRGRAVA